MNWILGVAAGLTAAPIVVLQVIVIYGTWKKRKEIRDSYMREYVCAVTEGNRDMAVKTLMKMTTICPSLTSKCLLQKNCPECTKSFGLRKDLENIFGEVIKP